MFRLQLTASADGFVGMMAERRGGIKRWGIHFNVGIFLRGKNLGAERVR